MVMARGWVDRWPGPARGLAAGGPPLETARQACDFWGPPPPPIGARLEGPRAVETGITHLLWGRRCVCFVGTRSKRTQSCEHRALHTRCSVGGTSVVRALRKKGEVGLGQSSLFPAQPPDPPGGREGSRHSEHTVGTSLASEASR